MIAEILHDDKHKALYIKLAKERNQNKLLELAKGIAERPNIKNKGAYFMKMVQVIKQEKIEKARAQRQAAREQGAAPPVEQPTAGLAAAMARAAQIKDEE